MVQLVIVNCHYLKTAIELKEIKIALYKWTIIVIVIVIAIVIVIVIVIVRTGEMVSIALPGLHDRELRLGQNLCVVTRRREIITVLNDTR